MQATSSTANEPLTVYPAYFDRARSVRNGRKVPLAAALENPNPYVLLKCTEQLGYEATFEQAKRHPRDPMTFGRIKVSVDGGASKTRLLQQICKIYEQVKPTVEEQFLNKTAPTPKSNAPVVAGEPAADGPKKATLDKSAVAIGPGGTVLVARSKKNKGKR